nr:MAG TPA: hypothetical protein [Caudoviricetes sp.]
MVVDQSSKLGRRTARPCITSICYRVIDISTETPLIL